MSVYSGPNTIQNGLVLHIDPSNPRSYPGAGSTLFDLSGNGNNGILTGAVFNSSNGGVISFDGINDYSAHPSMSLDSSLSVSCFARLQGSLFSPGVILSNCDVLGTSIGFHLEAWTIGPKWGILWGTNPYFRPQASDLIILNTWYYLCVVRSGSIGNWNTKFYINSNIVFNINTNINPASNNLVSIGRAGSFNGQYFPGQISNISIYNRALTHQEIINNFNATRGRYGI